MKSKLCTGISLLPFVLLFLSVACNKADHPENDSPENEMTTNFLSANNTDNSARCANAPDYGDSIIYMQPKSSGDYTVQPINNTGTQGTYLSWPEGLEINASTGVINVTQSETGVRYKIAFVKKGTRDTCTSQLILGGVTYMDDIYVLSDNDTLAMPVFNANPLNNAVCDASGDDDYPDNNNNGNNRCSFDDDFAGQKANDQKLRVRTKSGIINLKRSIDDGLFGKNVKNGESKKIKITYKLNDRSKKAKQKLTVQVYYYDKVSSIPVSLYNEVTDKRKSMFEYRVVNGKPRPPLLIIAGLSR